MRYFTIILISLAMVSCQSVQNVFKKIPLEESQNQVRKRLFPLINEHYAYVDSIQPSCKPDSFKYEEEVFKDTLLLSYRKASFLFQGKMYETSMMENGEKSDLGTVFYEDQLSDEEGYLGIILQLKGNSEFSLIRKKWKARETKGKSIQDLLRYPSENDKGYGKDTIMAGKYRLLRPDVVENQLMPSSDCPACEKAEFLILEVNRSKYKSLIEGKDILNYVFMWANDYKTTKKLHLMSVLRVDYDRVKRKFEFSEYTDIKDIYGIYPAFRKNLP